jgi:hypothetical protein
VHGCSCVRMGACACVRCVCVLFMCACVHARTISPTVSAGSQPPFVLWSASFLSPPLPACFLSSPTGAPCLPPAPLTPFRIAPVCCNLVRADGMICFVFEARWLPAYSTQMELREKLRAALANAKEGGFHEHQEALVEGPGGPR